MPQLGRAGYKRAGNSPLLFGPTPPAPTMSPRRLSIQVHGQASLRIAAFKEQLRLLVAHGAVHQGGCPSS